MPAVSTRKLRNMTRYVISGTEGIVYSYFEGIITQRDIIDHAMQLKQHPLFKPTFAEILDLTTVSRLNLSFSEVFDLSLSGVDPFAPSSKRAVIAKVGTSAYGVTRMWEGVSNKGDSIRIFSTLEEAQCWLANTDSTLS